LELLNADRVEVYLTDGDERLRLREANPPRSDERAIDTRTLWYDALRDPRTHGREGALHLARALWGDDVPSGAMFAPLVAGEEQLGLLVVSVPAPIPGADTALSAVGAHIAVTIKQHQLIERLQETNVVANFFRALAGGDALDDDVDGMSQRLGCDIRADHLVLHVEPWQCARPSGRRRPRRPDPERPGSEWRDIAARVEAQLVARLAALCDRTDGSLNALVAVSDRSRDDVFAALQEMPWEDGKGLSLTVGVSNICRGRSSFAQGFHEAAAAASVGGLIRGKPGVSGFDELGPYRYLLDVASQDDRDDTQRRLALLVGYDRRRGTQLLDTLEGYLDHRGNVVGTSRALFIHPNTLRQRLDRIQRESGIDLDHEDWLSLSVATKVVKLSRMRGSAREP
jgi:sugar diacid utilization regulator